MLYVECHLLNINFLLIELFYNHNITNISVLLNWI